VSTCAYISIVRVGPKIDVVPELLKSSKANVVTPFKGSLSV
jgi:hypothetical protein